MQLLLVLMKRTPKLIILAITLGLFLVFPVSNLISVFSQATGGTSASSVNEDDNNNTVSLHIGNTTNTTTGGLSVSSVGNGAIVSDRTGNTTNTTTGGLSVSSVLEGTKR